MHFLFCKANTHDYSHSVEHIIPESLGNTDHTLPRVWICDPCNNYFARKIEKPFLEPPFGESTRFAMGIQNKRGQIPPTRALHPRSRSIVEMMRSEDGWSVGVAPSQDEGRCIRSLETSRSDSLYIPLPPDLPEANAETSRFIGKVALEALAAKGLKEEGWNAELVNHPSLDQLRSYVRLGIPAITWPVSLRRIYDREHRFSEPNSKDFEVLNEWIILPTAQGKYYCVIAIFGVEFAINLGWPDLDGWNVWLANNDWRSSLLVTQTCEYGGRPS